MRRFALVSSFPEERIVIAIADISDAEINLETTILVGAARSEIARSLEELAPRIAPNSRLGDHKRPKSRRVMFVADPGRMGGAAGAGWKQAILAVCESWGHNVTFDETPVTRPSATMTSMDTFGGAALLVAVPASGAFSVAPGRHARWRHRTVELDRLAREELLDDLRLNFDLGLVEPPQVETWKQFADRADELEADYFILTPACRDALAACRYFDASRLWQITARLSEAARQRRVEGWNSGGPFALWARDRVGLEVALTDPGLGDTSFSFEGVALSWEPHVKVDDAKDEPIHLGRIYFAIDSTNERLVVHHIGLHL
jgi:hypothetical protein